jgi:hypothetical protein
VLVLFETCEESFSQSPSFIRQEIGDSAFQPHDYYDISTGEGTDWEPFMRTFPSINFTNLSHVSYSSDGQFLNTTMWILHPFEESPINQILSYGILIDVDPISDLSEWVKVTGWEGTDYSTKVIWNNNTWTKVTEEWADGADIRVLDKEKNYTRFFDSEKPYHVNLDFDLESIGYPQRYNIMFYTIDSFKYNNRYYDIVDFSQWIPIPPPRVDLELIPSSITLRPGEEKTVEIRIKLTPEESNFVQNITIFTYPIKGFETNISESNLFTTKTNTSTFLKIKAGGNTSTAPYIVPVNADIYSLAHELGPLNYLPYIQEKEGYPIYGRPAIIDPVSKYNYSYSVFDKLLYKPSEVGVDSISLPLTVTVKAFAINELFDSFSIELAGVWTENKEIVILLLGIFITPFGAWVFEKFVKRKKKKSKT